MIKKILSVLVAGVKTISAIIVSVLIFFVGLNVSAYSNSPITAESGYENFTYEDELKAFQNIKFQEFITSLWQPSNLYPPNLAQNDNVVRYVGKGYRLVIEENGKYRYMPFSKG